jgi:hypothetical protein
VALTQINNEQISNAAAGNVSAGIDAGTKIQANSITGAQLANTIAITTSGNIAAGAILTNNYLYANGQPFAGGGGSNVNYTDANVSAYLSSGSANANIITTANVSGAFVIGNGSALTAITGPNVVGNVPNADFATTATSTVTAGTVTTNAQPNITSVGTLSTLNVTGNISGNYILGNGSLLTGITANYSNSNVKTYLSAFDGNIIPSSNNAFTIGNLTNQWSSVYVGANTIYFNGVPLSSNVTTLFYDNKPLVSSSGSGNIVSTGNVAAGNVIADGFFYGNGTPLVGAQGTTGAQGVQGLTGTGIQIIGSAALTPGNENADLLAAFPGATAGQGVVNSTDGTLWVYQGASTWASAGNIVGPQGTTGATGVQGVAGATGAQGVQGVNGVQGSIGSTGAQGTVGTGSQGVQGETGTTGAATIIIGSAALSSGNEQAELNAAFPSATPGQGVIDQNGGNLWVLGTGLWTDVGQIVGPQGATGSTGIQGAMGSTGIQGTEGVIGAQGFTGSTGVQGTTGTTGTQGTTGTVGAQGFTGSTGVQGTTGSTGVQGVIGDTGAQGFTGSTGVQGTTGSDGVQGVAGDTGAQGVQGNTGATGAATTIIGTAALTVGDEQTELNAAFPSAVDGNGVIDSNLGNLWVLASGTWNNVGPIVGPQGTTGSTGVQGTTGSTGIQGTAGDTGAQGVQGVDGSQGTTGSTGVQGATGAEGAQGVQGVDGLQGSTGAEGIQGTTGAEGAQGVQGILGTQGTTGTQGPSGPSTTINAANTAANAEFYPVFVAATGSDQTASANANITVNPSTGVITSGGIITVGTASTGNITGAFAVVADYFLGDGSNITNVAATSVAANALTGDTLSANVLNSSLTSLGTLGSLAVVGTTDLTDLNASGQVVLNGVTITEQQLTTTGAGFEITGTDQGVQLQSTDTANSTFTLVFADNTGVGLVTNEGEIIVGLDGNVTVTDSMSIGGELSTVGNITGANIVAAYLYGDGSNITGIPAPVAESSFSIQSANFAVVEGARYGVDTTGGAVTATLPAAPTTGAAVFFADAGGAFATNNLTIDPDGGEINGIADVMTVNTNNQSFGLFYNGTTWRTY